MLRELYQLSTQLDTTPLGYSDSIAHWEIDLSFRLPVITLLQTQPKTGKPKPGKKCLLPDLRRNADEPLLIADAAEYVFGVADRGVKRHALYLNLLEQCIEQTQDEGAKKVLVYIQACNLEDLDRTLSEQLPLPADRQGNPKPREPFWWARDRVCFASDGELITDRPAIRQFWATYYASKQGTVEGTCLLTGEVQPTLAQKMPVAIKGIPNTQSSGAQLVSFDKPAYQSYGWEGNANAPIGFEAAVRAHKILDRILHDETHHYRLGNQTFIFWGDLAEGLNPEFWDDPAAAIAKSIFVTPERPQDLPGTRALSRRFYLAALKGNKGRIALSDWNEQTRDRIKACVQNFVDCQKLVEGERAKPVWVLRNCAFRDAKKEYTDRIATALVKAALFGHPLPEDYALKIIDRICQEQDVMRNLDRAKALSFYLETIMSQPNPDEIAYILGRVAFLMHWAQKTAQNLDREDTNVSRSLRVLSSSPAQVFPRLYHGCITNHLEDRDALKERGKTLKNLKTRLNQEFLALGDYSPSELPNLFTTRQQAQFFIGFAKCRAEYFQKRVSSVGGFPDIKKLANEDKEN